jgi:hypothetical protein
MRTSFVVKISWMRTDQLSFSENNFLVSWNATYSFLIRKAHLCKSDLCCARISFIRNNSRTLVTLNPDVNLRMFSPYRWKLVWAKFHKFTVRLIFIERL